MSNNTIVPGIQGFPQMPNRQNGGFPQFPGMVSPKGQLFGFLYSVSKTLAGEYWPLYLGANTIGRVSQNNVVLEEASVSESHASIHIICRAGKLIVYISDSASKTGTLVNGQVVRGEADLKNGDFITVGENYVLYLILVNPTELGLGVAENFVVAQNSPVPQAGKMPLGGLYQQPTGPHPTVVEGQSGPVPMGGHTVIMNPDNKF